MRKSPRSHHSHGLKEILGPFNAIVAMRYADKDLDSKIEAVETLAKGSYNPATAQERDNSRRAYRKLAANSQSTLESKSRGE
jgi:hypothetical protein